MPEPNDDITRWSDAINDRNLKAIASLLQEEPDLANQDFVPREKLPFYHSDTYSPARYAVMKNDLELMRTFLEGGVKPSFGFSVESVEMAQLVLSYGVELDTWDNLEYTPVVMACWFPNADLMKVLLDAGASPNYPKQNSGATPLMVLAERADDGDESIKIATQLIKHGADVNQKAFSGLEDEPVTWDAYNHDVCQGHETALHWAARHGKPKLARFLIEHGADKDARTTSIMRDGKNPDGSLKFEPFEGQTPLDWAFRGGNDGAIRLLGGGDLLDAVSVQKSKDEHETDSKHIPAGADHAFADGDSDTPLHRLSAIPVERASPMQRVELAKTLLSRGEKIDARHPTSNHTPLSLAVEQGSLELVEFLLRRGAATNLDDPAETNPLAISVRHGFREIEDALKRRMNRYQFDAWHKAIETDDVDTVRRLLTSDETAGRQCLQKFRVDGTWFLVDPLCEAARRNCIAIVEEILKHRSANTTFGQGQYNGEVAGAYCLAWAGSSEMRTFLLDHGADASSIEGIEVPNLDDVTVPHEQIENDLGLQWQLAIETRETPKVQGLLAEFPQLSRQVIMDRWRDGRMGHRSLDPLYQCAQSGHLEIVRAIIEAGYDRDRLPAAFELAAPEVAAYLIDEGVDARPDLGLMAYIGHAEALKFWLARGYQIHAGMLHDTCCGRGRFRGNKDDFRGGWPDTFRETARVLIEAGADVNERNPGGNRKYEGCRPWVTNRETPLHYAAGNWDPLLVQMLIDAGADKTLTNDLGETPYDWARRYDAPETTLLPLALNS